ADRPGRTPDRDDTGRHVPGHHRAGADHGVVADGHARQHDDPAAQPHVVPDGDGPGGLQLVAARLRLQRVCGGEQLHVGPDLAVLADGDRRDVQRGQVVVDEGAGADGDVAAVVDVQRRPDLGLLAERAEEFFQQGPRRPGVLGEGGLVAGGQAHGPLLAAGDLRVVGDVEVTRLHAFEVRAGVVREVVRRHGPSLPAGAYARTLPRGRTGAGFTGAAP